MDPMKDYPTLGLIVRHGRVGGLFFTLAAAVLALWLAWPLGALPAVAIAALLASIIGVLTMSYVEIVRLITEMLLPQ